MEQQYGRRAFLARSAAVVGAALLAACGGTSAAPDTARGATTTANVAIVTSSPSGAPPSVVPATATTGQGTAPARATSGAVSTGADLARMLAFMPDQADLVRGGVTFTDLAAAKALHGLADIRGIADLQGKHIAYGDFLKSIQGCVLSDRMGRDYSDADFRALTGYDLFQIDREIAFVDPDNGFSRLEGAFDRAAIDAALRKGGYTTATYQGATYLTVRADNAVEAKDPLSADVGAALNRVAADDAHLTSAPTSASIQVALDAEAKRKPALDGSPTWRVLADAFRDALGMTTFAPNGDFADPRLPPGGRAQVQAWGALHPAQVTAMGYTEDGNGQRMMRAARVYGAPADANADAAELVARIRGYTSLQSRQPIMPGLITGVTSRVLTSGGKGVLIADMPLAPPPVPASIWYAMVANKDTLFLAEGRP